MWIAEFLTIHRSFFFLFYFLFPVPVPVPVPSLQRRGWGESGELSVPQTTVSRFYSVCLLHLFLAANCCKAQSVCLCLWPRPLFLPPQISHACLVMVMELYSMYLPCQLLRCIPYLSTRILFFLFHCVRLVTVVSPPLLSKPHALSNWFFWVLRVGQILAPLRLSHCLIQKVRLSSFASSFYPWFRNS